MDLLRHDDDGTNRFALDLSSRTRLRARQANQYSTLGTEQGRAHFNKLPLREQLRLRGPTRNRKKTNCLNIRKNNPKSKSYDSPDPSSCSEDEEERRRRRRISSRSPSRSPRRRQQRRRPRPSRRPPSRRPA
jgi:hypothetical protein